VESNSSYRSVVIIKFVQQHLCSIVKEVNAAIV
jgi:hypothetical protein